MSILLNFFYSQYIFNIFIDEFSGTDLNISSSVTKLAKVDETNLLLAVYVMNVSHGQVDLLSLFMLMDTDLTYVVLLINRFWFWRAPLLIYVKCSLECFVTINALRW